MAARRHPGSIWPEADAKLRERWEAGAPCAQIGRELGVSSHAVIGRAHRIGLPQHVSATGRPHPLGNLPPKPRNKPCPRRLPVNAVTLPKLGPPSVLQLDPARLPTGACQFPLTDKRPWRFCEGICCALGSPWCAKHKRVVYLSRAALRVVEEV